MRNWKEIHNLMSNIKKYKPYKGFFDLRKFNINIRDFKKCWDIQYDLFHTQKDSEYIKKWHPAQWQAAQEVSGKLQLFLFNKGLKNGEKL